MLDTDAIELVSYLIGSFVVGFGIGFLTISFRKALDTI
jgi:F0F1-type ATP synthase assembly protein I